MAALLGNVKAQSKGMSSRWLWPFRLTAFATSAIILLHLLYAQQQGSAQRTGSLVPSKEAVGRARLLAASQVQQQDNSTLLQQQEQPQLQRPTEQNWQTQQQQQERQQQMLHTQQKVYKCLSAAMPAADKATPASFTAHKDNGQVARWVCFCNQQYLAWLA